MNKCEHNQKITLFCVAEACQYKESSGCETCLKKYHNHPGQATQMNEEELQNIIKKFALENAIKPKCRLLQQSIYNYFNQIKTQMSTSFDLSCKNIINQIGYPYLFATNTLSTYKRLKNKEYRKISQKQLRGFVEMAGKIEDKELAKEENKIYLNEIKSCNEVIVQLEGLIKSFQNVLRNYNNQFTHETLAFQKICEINRTIQGESPFKNFKRTSDLKEKELPYGKEAQKITLFNAPIDFIPNSKIQSKNNDAKTAEMKVKIMEKVEVQPQILSPSPSFLQPPKTARTRDVSLDKKMIKEHKFPSDTLHEQKPRETQRSESGLPHHKIQSLKQQLNYKEMEINEKKKLLIGIMKQNQKMERPFEKLQSFQLSPIKPRMAQLLRKQQSDTRSANESKSSRSSEDLTTLEQHSKTLQNTKNYAFTKLPIAEDALPKKPQEKQQIKKKLIIIPTEISKNGSNKPSEVDSPLYKKRRIQTNNDQSRFKDPSREKYEPFYRKPQVEPKSVSKQLLEIKQNEQKSLALLLKSLHLSAEDAVVYLQASLKYADNNLSAAQYLSYIYLQLNRPKDCLNLCNKLLDKMQNSNEQQVVSINLNNNKAAAFNKLGRYSEAILILERCLKNKQKDTLFKNLGDSYFSIGNYEKAIFNYQKSLKMNSINDQCHYNLAVCLYLQQNYQNAKLSIRKALQFNSKNEQYLQLQSFIEIKLKIA